MAASLAPSHHAVPSPAAARPPCVLVAEDDDELRALLCAALRRDGYLVVEARDGPELLERIGDGLIQESGAPEPDVVVSDIRMPGWSGLQVLASLRRAHESLPMVLITAFGDEATHAQARALGADAMLDKPFDLDDLRTVVLNLLPKTRTP